MPASDGTFVRALLLALALACVPHPLQAAEPAPGAGPSTPTAAHAGASVTPTLHDIVADLGRTSAMLRQFATTLRDTADWNVLASHLEDPAVTSFLRALEEGRDTLSRARYMELIDADTRIRERVRAVNDATDELGRLTRKVEEDLAILDREAARWPERAKLAREREAPAEILRLADAVHPEIAATRDRLRARRDQLLVAFGQGVALQTRMDAVRATIAERRERISAELGAIEDVPIWRQGAVAFPRDEVKANVALVRHELADHLREHGAWLGVLLATLTAFLFVALRQPQLSGMPRDAVARRSVGMALVGALAVRPGIPRLARPEGALHFLSPDRIRGAAARRHRRDEEFRRADSGNRLDTGLGGIRQRVSDIRGDESRARPIAAHHSAPAVRRGADARLAPGSSRAVDARPAPHSAAPIGADGAADTGCHYRRERAWPHACRARAGRAGRHRPGVLADLCLAGMGARSGLCGSPRHAARAEPAQRARAGRRDTARAASARPAVLLDDRRLRVHAGALRARRSAAHRQRGGGRERERRRRDDHGQRDPLRPGRRGRDLAGHQGRALHARPRDPAAARPAHRRPHRHFHDRRLRAGADRVRPGDGRARHRPHQGHLAGRCASAWASGWGCRVSSATSLPGSS